ncbi:hypothetical protein F511_06993 [Dorcoceras hygrometricum]|uniref:Uncharacterized protein n=1 Tax=Dorcoceras hygrometricum TaxID=472368 RepID=A0A2Z7AQF3_9LAMI|nr:hypothetical protein F511_06993 [Dorcoceras hygrometricum]
MVPLEPPGPEGGPDGRSPAFVAGAGRTNAETSRWSRRHAAWLVRPLAATSSPWLAHVLDHGWSLWNRIDLGVVHPEGLRQWWPEQVERSRGVPAGRGGSLLGCGILGLGLNVAMVRSNFGWNDFRIQVPMDSEVRSGEVAVAYGSRDHAETLGSLGLNGAGDDPADELIPIGGDDL